MPKGMDRTTVIELHQEAAKYYSLALSKFRETQSYEDNVAEKTWYDVCCWFYTRIGEADE